MEQGIVDLLGSCRLGLRQGGRKEVCLCNLYLHWLVWGSQIILHHYAMLVDHKSDCKLEELERVCLSSQDGQKFEFR